MVLELAMTAVKNTEIIQKVTQKYDEEDKYYLTPNDGSGTLITLVQLKNENFDEWVDSIEIVLESKNKLGFLNISIPQPSETNVKYKRWKKINTLVSSWILNTIEPSLRSSITKTRIVKNIWDELP